MDCTSERFITNLIEINRRAGVEPELIDLLAAYARLCLRDGKDPEFFSENPAIATDRATIRKFISANRHLDERSLSFLVSYAEMMRERRLPFLFNTKHLAHFLEMEREVLLGITGAKEKHYSEFFIPKSNGGRRRISAPRDLLKSIQRKILTGILVNVAIHPSATGFKQGRSIVTNAETHVNQEIVIRMDIKDFFPSITYPRVKGVYTGLGYPEGVAEMLTELVTFHERLPMGAPTSPYLSNIVAFRMDRRFTNLGEKTGFRYSRYADDLAFSSRDKGFSQNIPFFRQIIEDEGFEVNEKKTAIARKGGRQKLTGVVVNEKVNVERKTYKRLRAVLHNCAVGDLRSEMLKWGASDPGAFRNALHGQISFVRMLNIEKGQRLLEAFSEIPWPA